VATPVKPVTSVEEKQKFLAEAKAFEPA